MPSVGACKSLCLCIILVGLSAAQKTNPAAGSGGDVRPAIFQRGAQGVQIVASPSVSQAQLSTASFRLASNDEVDGMEQTLEHYVIAFESLSLPQVKQVWPDLDRQHTKAFKNVFEAFKGAESKPRLGLQCAVPKVAADTANVECLETLIYGVGKGKTKEVGPARVSIQLRGQSSHWVVLDMKGTG